MRDGRTDPALDGLAGAVERFLEEAKRHAGGNGQSRAPGTTSWSPAQTTRHLALHLETATRELRGGPPSPPVARGVERILLRWLLLPHILFHRSWPVRLVSAEEHTPSGTPVLEDEMERLRALAATLLKELAQADRGGDIYFTHPHFGRLAADRFLRLSAIHIEHHRRRLAEREPIRA